MTAKLFVLINYSWLNCLLDKVNNEVILITEMEQSVKQMLKLIEEGGDSFEEKAEMYNRKRPELVAHVEEFYRMYQALAERCDHLTGELFKSNPSMLQAQVTPDQKLGVHRSSHQSVNMDSPLSSGSASSELSLKEGGESFSSSSSDSESESITSSINRYLGTPSNGDGKGLQTMLPSMKEKLQVTEDKDADCIPKVGTHASYEELLGKITEYSQKLEFSEEEIARLNCELKKNESATGTLQAQLESAWREIEMQEANLELEKRQVLELQKQTAELENRVSESDHKICMLEEELEETKKRLMGSEEENEKLKHELTNEISVVKHQLEDQRALAVMLETQLQDSIIKHMAFVSDHDREVESLNAALHNAQENFSRERAQLQSDISSLSKQVVLLETRLEEWRAKEMEMKGLHEAQETVLQGEIEQLKAELSERGDIVQALNKNLDALKVTYDMLMAEKDELSARVDTLIADVNSWDNQIQQLEDHLRQLRIERVELIAGTESSRKLVDELSWRVKELEREVERQRVVISDRAEEKREAIRQLCFSLEHYRSGYQELRQAFIGHKRLPILAS